MSDVFRPAQARASIAASNWLPSGSGPSDRNRGSSSSLARATIFIEPLPIPQLVAALAHLSVFVTNNTGPMHIATAVGTPVVVLDQPTNKAYMPLEARHRVIHGRTIMDISVDEAYITTRSVFTAERTASLFAS